MKHKIRYGSVCSGVEAASLAWQPLGWEPAFFAEVEPFPCAVLQQRFNATKPLRPLDPAEAVNEKDRAMREQWLKQINRLPDTGTVPNLGDFTKITKEDYHGNIDLLVGGTPCQDVSVAGKRAGFDGHRSSLALDFVRLAYQTKAKWFVWENVQGALSSNGGRDFARLLSLFCGFTIIPPRNGFCSAGFVRNARTDRFGLAWRVLDAQYTKVPGFPFAIPQRRCRLFVIGYFGDWRYPATVLLEPEILSWFTPTRKKKEKVFTGGSETRFRESSAQEVICFHGSQDPIFNYERANAINRNNGLENCILSFDAYNGTLSDVFSTIGSTRHDAKHIPSVLKQGKVRRLTPLECERLMGFPDNHTKIEWNGKSANECPDAPRYKACGNSMCVNVMEWIGRRIEAVK